MPLPASGEISLNDIHTEIARSAANNTEVSVSDNLVLTLGDVSTTVNQQGNYSFSDWYGKGNAISIATLNGINTITEGNAIALIGKGNVGTYYYDINHITTSNADFSNVSSLSGSFTISTQQAGASGSIFGAGSTVDEGTATEGNETCEFRLRYGASNATIEDTVTITLQDPPAAGFGLTQDKTTIDEGGAIYGDTVTFTASGTNVPNGTVYYLHINHGQTNNADFNETFPIAITMNNNSGTATVSVVSDSAEGAETFECELRTGTSGSSTLLATSSTITVVAYDLVVVPVVSPPITSVDEGSSLNFAGEGPVDGTSMWWEVVHGTTTAADFSGATSGTVTANPAGLFMPQLGNSFVLNGAADGTTEGNETFTVRLKPSPGSSTILATTPTLTMNDTSTQVYSITPAATSMNEGVGLNFTFVGAPSTTHYWSINHGTTNNSDFTTPPGNTVIMNSGGTASYSNMVVTAADATTEGSQTFSVDLRTGSASGPVVANSGTITINDTSTAPALTEDSYYQMHLLRTITGQGSYWATTTDSLASYAGQKGRIVFAYTNGTSGTSYRGDMQLDSISFDGNTFNFDAPSGHDWVTSTALNQSLVYSGMDPGSLGTFQQRIANYSTLATGENTYKWNVDSGGTSSGSTALSSAHTGSYYVYAETSGTGTSGGQYTLASPLVQLSNSPGNLSYAFARYGNNIGTTRVYWAQNQTTDAHPPPVAVDVYGPWTSTTTNAANWINGNSSSSVSLQYGQWGSISDGDTCRLLIAYISGNGYQGDLQLDDWWANVTSTSTSIQYAYPLSIDSTQSQVSNQLITYTSAAWNTSSAPTTSDIETIYNNSTWTNVGYGSSQGTWNLDRSGTPSGGTGLTNVYSSYYNYFEATGAGYSYKMRLLRSKPFSAIANRGFRGRIGHYGSNMGRMRVYIVKE